MASSVKSVKILSPEEELELRRERFEELVAGSLFDLGRQRFFIAVRKRINEDTWIVIELTDENRKRIIRQVYVLLTTLSFDEMAGLNILCK